MRKILLISIILMIGLNACQFAMSSWQRQVAYKAPVIQVNSVSAQPDASSKVKDVTPLTLLTPLPAPHVDPAVLAAQALTKAGLNPAYAGLYLAAQARSGTPWQLIAAVHMIESHQSGDTTRTSYAGA